MARGSQVKQEITNKILETFDGAFLYNGGKELRVPMIENGELVQVKITLTAAKVNVEPEGGVVTPTVKTSTPTTSAPVAPEILVEPTQEEKENVARLMAELGL